jgi:hypothetical protein
LHGIVTAGIKERDHPADQQNAGHYFAHFVLPKNRHLIKG